MSKTQKRDVYHLIVKDEDGVFRGASFREVKDGLVRLSPEDFKFVKNERWVKSDEE